MSLMDSNDEEDAPSSWSSDDAGGFRSISNNRKKIVSQQRIDCGVSFTFSLFHSLSLSLLIGQQTPLGAGG